MVYSVSYWDSSQSGLRLRLLPLLAEGFRPPPVPSEGLELVLPAWEKASEGLLVVRSEYLQEGGGGAPDQRQQPESCSGPRGLEDRSKSRCAHLTGMWAKRRL